jgi:hypothetical protein
MLAFCAQPQPSGLPLTLEVLAFSNTNDQLILESVSDQHSRIVDFVCLIARSQGEHPRRFTPKQYLSLSNASVETWEGQQTPVDRPLADLGLKRQAVLRIPFFVPTILSIARTDLVITVPRDIDLRRFTMISTPATR